MPLVSPLELIASAKTGKVVSFPTDTVPALAVLPQYGEAIFALKGRNPDKPLILMGATPEELWSYVEGSAEEAHIWQEIARRFWPGSLTLVLPTPNSTLGIRVPNHGTAREILAQTGPMLTTSANLSGERPLTDPFAIVGTFPQVSVCQEGEWDNYSGLPSTVAQWTKPGWKILRQGPIFLS